MAERNKLASIPGQPLPERKGNFLSDLWDEASGAFARYGRRSGAQRDASLALMSQAADPNIDPFTGAGMKALGLAGLVTHPLAFFPTREEWDQRLQAAGNDSRIGRSIGGFLSDLPSLIDPQMAAGGAALAAAPIVGKLGRGIGDLAGDATDAELAALRARLQAEAAQTGGATSSVSREQALQGLAGGDSVDAVKSVAQKMPEAKILIAEMQKALTTPSLPVQYGELRVWLDKSTDSRGMTSRGPKKAVKFNIGKKRLTQEQAEEYVRNNPGLEVQETMFSPEFNIVPKPKE